MKNKLGIRIGVGIAITAVMIYMAARELGGLNPAVLFQSNVNWWLFLVAALMFGAGQFVRVFVYPYGIDRGLDIGTASRIVLVGNLANMFLPLRAGEGLRFTFFPPSYRASRRTRLLVIPGVVDVVVMALLSILAVPLAAGNMHPGTERVLEVIAGVLFLLSVSFVVAGLVDRRLRRVMHRCLTQGSMRMVGWVFCSWTLLMVSNWVGMLAFQFSPVTSIRMAFAVFATSNIVLFIPSSPGGLGVFEYAVVLALRFFGVPGLSAVPVALLLHLAQYVALLPLGAVAYLSGLRLERSAVAPALRKST